MKKVLYVVAVLVLVDVLFWLTGGSVDRDSEGNYVVWWPWD